MHASAFVKHLKISQAIVPLFPGVFSAFGCIVADIRHDFMRTVRKTLDEIQIDDIQSAVKEWIHAGKELIRREKVPVTETLANIEADMSYLGQRHAIKIRLPRLIPDISSIQKCFEEEYQRAYGYLRPDVPICIMNLRMTVLGVRPKFELERLNQSTRPSVERALKGTRSVYFDGHWMDTSVYDRWSIATGSVIQGPAILEQLDSTTIIEPGTIANIDRFGNVVIKEIRNG
jgi:N-methylhydantoinase A